jgi:hypothetical protein
MITWDGAARFFLGDGPPAVPRRMRRVLGICDCPGLNAVGSQPIAAHLRNALLGSFKLAPPEI